MPGAARSATVFNAGRSRTLGAKQWYGGGRRIASLWPSFCWWSRRQLHEGSVVCLSDALDDWQAEADACVIGAYAPGAALKRLGKRGQQLRRELLAGALDGEHSTAGLNAGRDPQGTLFRQVADDRVVHEVRAQ